MEVPAPAFPAGEGLQFQVLGSVRGWQDGVELELGRPQQRAMLALLLVRAGQSISLREFVDLLWAGDPPSSATNIVHKYIGTLRRLLEPELPTRATGRWLVRQFGGYRFEARTEMVDLLSFRRLREEARRAAAEGDPGQALRLLLKAIELWQGPCAAGTETATGSAPAFAAVDREYGATIGEAADVALRCGRPQEVIAVVRQAAERDRLAEPLQARLMLLLSAAGHQAEALRVFESVRAALLEELGIDPGHELRAAQQRVLRQEAGAVDRADSPAVASADRVDGVGSGPAPAPGTGTGTGPGPGPDRRSASEDGPKDRRSGPDGGPKASGPRGRSDQSSAPRTPHPAQLPAGLSTFTGRSAELAAALSLAPSQSSPDTVVISAIDGMAGMGKTTLALHWAHQVIDQYPDGQLYVDLRGFSPSGSVMQPTEALQGFLEAMGVTSLQLPATLDGQIGLYRSLLAGRRVLVLLDNARDVDQVRPLLPGSPGCLVIVTSRNRMAGLIATAGARLITLDVPSVAEAREILARRLGADRVAAEPEAVEQIISLCARLPLALAVVAARAAAHPTFPLTAIAAELQDYHGSLDAFAAGEATADARAVFSWSYEALSSLAAELFRLLPVHCGPDIALPAAASLVGAPPKQVKRLFAELADANLVTEHLPGRYVMHDLIRAYAGELSEKLDTQEQRSAALGRQFDHYLHTAAAGSVSLLYRRKPIVTEPLSVGVTPESFATQDKARAWFTAEQLVLGAAVQQAASTGFSTHCWQLALALQEFYHQDGHWHDWRNAMRTGLKAAQMVGDLFGQAQSLRSLAGASFMLGRYDDALGHLDRALDLFTKIGAEEDQGFAHTNAAVVLQRQGHFRLAIGRNQRAHDLFARTGNRTGQTQCIDEIAWCYAGLEDFEQSLSYLRRALAIAQELGDIPGEGSLWHCFGYSQYRLGHHPEAIECLQRALERYHIFGNRSDIARVLTNLGDAFLAVGDRPAAVQSWQDALAIFYQLQVPEADELQQRLADVLRSGGGQRIGETLAMLTGSGR